MESESSPSPTVEVQRMLEAHGFQVPVPSILPVNDGRIACGQASVAAAVVGSG